MDSHQTVDELVAAIEDRICSDLGGKRRGDEIAFRCPFHDDEKPSASWNVAKRCFRCRACREKGGWKKLADKFDLEIPKSSHARWRKKAGGAILATYSYLSASGDLLFETVRTESKAFYQRRPDGRGGWINNLDGVEPVLYRLPELNAANPSELVFFVEGEKDVDRLRAAGLVATCNPMGAGGWQDHYADALRGRQVVILPDNDEPGRRHAHRVLQGLLRVAKSVRMVELDGLPPKGDVSDWLDAGHSASELMQIARATNPVPRASLDDVVAIFRRYLHLPDASAVFAVLGAYAANRMEGDPVWILIIGPASGGKTEVLLALLRLPDVRLVGTLTEPSLLSGVSKRDKVVGAKGGFLHEIGAFGIVVLKDFTSVLSMHRDARAAVLGALRECYDGAYSRGVGTDGGKLLSWTGKLGLVAGCTPSIDSHHAVISTMGERFVFLRLPPVDPVAQGMRALDHSVVRAKARCAESLARPY